MKIFLLLVLFIPTVCLCQNFPLNDQGRIEYTEVIAIDSSSADDLYKRAKLFISNNFKNPGEVIGVDDFNNKIIVINGTFTTEPGHIKFKATLQFKDGRYKYSVTDLTHKFINAGGYNLSGGALENSKPDHPLSLEIFDKVKAYTVVDVKQFISTLKNSMTDKNNW
jgi:hypothetical protein